MTEETKSFGECRALLQVYAGAVSGKLAKYSINTPQKLVSSFSSADKKTNYEITCLAAPQKMFIKKTKE